MGKKGVGHQPQTGSSIIARPLLFRGGGARQPNVLTEPVDIEKEKERNIVGIDSKSTGGGGGGIHVGPLYLCPQRKKRKGKYV